VRATGTSSGSKGLRFPIANNGLSHEKVTSYARLALPYGDSLFPSALVSIKPCISGSAMLYAKKLMPGFPPITIANKYVHASKFSMSVHSNIPGNSINRVLECISRAMQIADWRKIHIHHVRKLHSS